MGSHVVKISVGALWGTKVAPAKRRFTSSLLSAGLWLDTLMPPNSRNASSGLDLYSVLSSAILGPLSQCGVSAMCLHSIALTRSSFKHAAQMRKQSTTWKKSEPSGLVSSSSVLK